jgi:hypothetical protein
VIDVEMELEENLELIAKTLIASGNFLAIQSVRAAKPKTQSAEL